MHKLTRRRQFKNKSKRSKCNINNKYSINNKTRRGKYIKKRRSVTRRRVLRGGVLTLRSHQKKLMDSFFKSLNFREDSRIVEGVPAYYANFNEALFYLDALYSSLGQTYFIVMLGSDDFKRRYNETFYDDNCFAKLRLIQFLSYIYANVSNGNTITQGDRILHFTPGRFKKVNRLKSSGIFKPSSSSKLKSSGIFKPSSSGRSKSSSAVKHTSEGSVIWMLLALLCGADAQCLNTTSYVAHDFKSREGHKLLVDIHENLTKLSSSDYLDKKTQQYLTMVILPSMVIDKDINKLGFNTTILCSILKGMLHIDEDEMVIEEDEAGETAAAVEMEEAD